MTEMEAMLDQLQSAPIENAGLVAFLRKQCEAIGFRTGAGSTSPPARCRRRPRVDPGARQAIARVAQEALSNVARHARARERQRLARHHRRTSRADGEDDGGGFSRERRRGGHGHGEHGGACRGGRRLARCRRAPRAAARPFVSRCPCAELPSPRAYIVRAVAWGAVALHGAGSCCRADSGVRPVWLTLALIAAIAVARYTVAATR